MVHHRSALVTALVLVAAAVAACTDEDDSDPPAEVVSVPALLDHSSVAGLVPHLDTSEGEGDRRSVGTVAVPGDVGFGSLLKRYAATQVAEYNKVRSPGTDNEINVAWDPALAAGPILGVRMATRVYTGGAHSRASGRTFYTNVDTEKAWTTEQLVSDRETLAKLANAALKVAGKGEVSAADVTVDLRFGGDGSVTTVIAPGDADAAASGDVAVRVDRGAASDLLNADGRAIQRAAEEGSAFAGVPDPQPTTPAPSTVTPVGGDPQPSGDDVDCDKLSCIAITYDDGPGAYTMKLLKELAAKNVKATFFVVGQNVATQPGLVKAEVDAGHAVGNHSWNHPQLTTMSDAEVADQVDRTAAAIKKAAGITTDLMRPPYGATNSSVAEILAKRGDAQILWNVDTEDWKNRDVAQTTANALAGARRNAIILMHDIHPTTVQAAPAIIDALRQRGYTLVTVPQLLGSAPTPGKAYFEG